MVLRILLPCFERPQALGRHVLQRPDHFFHTVSLSEFCIKHREVIALTLRFALREATPSSLNPP